MRRRSSLVSTAAVAIALVVGLVPAAEAASAPVGAPRVRATGEVEAGGGTLRTTTISVPSPAAARSRTGRGAADPITVPVPAGTQQVGVSWTGDPAASFELRTRSSAGGAWSTATPLGGEGEEGPDGEGGRPGAGPLWLGHDGVVAVQVRLASATGPIADLRVEAMAWRPGPATKAADVIARPATAAGGPPIHLRSSWAPGGWNAADPVCGPKPKINARLDQAIVHHTDGTNTYRAADVPGILAGIYRFHTATRGWCDIGYNLLVDRFGGVWEGRLGGLDEAAWGGHAKGFNTRSVGVALLGTHQTGVAAATPTTAELASLRDVLAWKLGSQGIDPQATVAIPSGGNDRFPEGKVVVLPTIAGHGDTGSTACPGDLVRARLAQLRKDVAARIAATDDPARWATFGTGARFFTQVLTDAEGAAFGSPSRIGTATSKVVRVGLPIAEAAAPLVISAGSDNRIGVVDRLHRTLWGRPATTAELTRDVALRDRPTKAAAIADGLLAGADGVARYRSLDDAAFVTALYRNALARTPSADELAAQRAFLAAGHTRGELVVVVSDSTEYRRQVAVAERVTVAWFALLRRAPSAAELRTWTARLTAGSTDADLVKALLASPEWSRRFR